MVKIHIKGGKGPPTIIASNPIDTLKEVIRGEEVAKGGDVER